VVKVTLRILKRLMDQLEERILNEQTDQLRKALKAFATSR